MSEQIQTLPESKQCPICSADLPTSEFGICKARKDGRNLYCKSCIRKKVSDSRRDLKEYKNRPKPVSDQNHQNPSSENNVRVVSRASPKDRVKKAIKNGNTTQKKIAIATKLGNDEIGDALAVLLLWERQIRTEVVDDNRHYFIIDVIPNST